MSGSGRFRFRGIREGHAVTFLGIREGHAVVQVLIERPVSIVRLEVEEQEVVARRPRDCVVDRSEGVAVHEVRYLLLRDLVFRVVLHAPEEEAGAVEAYRPRHALYRLRSHNT